MLLLRLKEYDERQANNDDADEETTLPDEYGGQAVPWIVSISSTGTNPHIIRTSGGVGKRDPGKRISIPYLKRSGTKIKPQLLADKAELALGLTLEDPERTQQRHQDFVTLVEACARATGEPTVIAVSTFLQQLDIRVFPLPQELNGNEFITFEVEGTRPIDLPVVQAFWARIAPRLGQRSLSALNVDLLLSWLDTEEAGVVGQCLVCGKQRPIARVHPVAIKVPRAVSDQQLSIVSANQEAFYSYGLEQSVIAPTCRPCAAAYAKGLNRLARDEATHLLLGDSILLFWTRKPVGLNLHNTLSQPKEADVRALVEASYSGDSIPQVDDTGFYAVLLSASGGRAVVRDWIDTTVGAVKANLKRWFAGHEIVGEYGQIAAPLGVYRLADATVRTKPDGRADREDLVATTPRALLATALLGTTLPRALLTQVIRRVRAEQNVSHHHAALIKLILQEYTQKEQTMGSLNPEHVDPGYQCGRLLAVLAVIQEEAIGTPTIIDRFFGTASSAPGSVFQRLVRGAQPHLTKIANKKEPTYYALSQRLEEVLDRITLFPAVLTPEQQGLFVLGFYHQRAHDRAERKAAVERKRTVESSGHNE